MDTQIGIFFLGFYSVQEKKIILVKMLLRWLEIVSNTYILIDRYNHSLSLDATIMVSKNCPTIGEHVGTIFVTQ